MDLIAKLLTKDKNKRLGSTDDMLEILRHPFFADLDFDLLLKKQIDAQFKPEISNDLNNMQYFNVKSD